MESVYIGIGSNMGRRMEHCSRAISLMGRLEGCILKAVSPFYETEPVGVEEQDPYVNSVVCMETDLSAATLLRSLLAIEKDMGRVRRKKWDARVIDLDILLFGSRIIKTPDLVVPHPLMHVRRFVLTPLLQIAPELVHPVLHRSVRELAESLPDEGQGVEILRGPEC